MKKLLLGLLVLCMAFTLISCEFGSKGPKEEPTPVDPTPVDPDPIEELTHLNNFVIVLSDGAQVREYREGFDELITDFSTESAATVKNHLRVVVDNELPDAPMSADASIYKMATGTYQLETFDGIGFRMRTLGNGKLDLSNLVLALRGDDAFDVYPINLAEAVDDDGDELPELSAEYQDFIVCPRLSIEDDTTEYQLAGNLGASGVKVLDIVLGFHLYLTGEAAQILEIEEVFAVKGAERVTLDKFNRERVSKADDSCWWRDSKGFIVQQGVKVEGQETYTVDLGETTGANLVLQMMGDTSTLTVGGKAWQQLKDAEGNQVPEACNGAFFPIVVNLEQSGLTDRQLVLASEKEVVISKVFVSDLVDREKVTEYPEMDLETISMFDNFNREQSGFDGDYDKSIANPVVIAAGLNYALSYHNGELVTVTNGAVVFEGGVDVDYINFKEGRTVYEGQGYLVLVVKLEDGATLDNFRFNVGNGIVYANQMVSGFGLPIPLTMQEGYPYTNQDGYMWLVIDLAESGMEVNAEDGFIDFYYSGVGKLYIDCAFYADRVGAHKKYVETEIATLSSANLGGYAYAGAFNTEGANLVKMVFACEDESTLKTIRIEGGNTAWFKDGAVVDMEGNPISGDTPLAGLEIVVDLAASGIDTADWIHVHTGDFDGTVTAGAFSATVYKMEEAQDEVQYVETEIATLSSANLGGYAYAGAFNTEGANLVKMVFACEDESTLKTIRIEGGNTAWFKDGAVVDMEGNPISGDTPLAGLEIVVDLAASGIDTADWIHVHTGDFDGTVTAGAFSATVYKMEVVEKQEYEETEIATLSSANLGGYAYAGAFNTEGANLVKMVFACEDESTLKTIRIEGGNTAWFKDGAVVDMEGNPISGDTPLAGLEIVVDLAASGIDTADWIHVHTGDFDGTVTAGAFSATVYKMVKISQYDAIMAGLTQ